MVYRKKSTAKKSYRKKPVYKKTAVYKGPKVELKRNMRAISDDITSTPMTSVNSRPFVNISTGTHADARIGNGVFAKGHLLSGVLRNLSAKTMIVRVIYAYNRRVANSQIDTTSPLFLALGDPEDAVTLGFQSMYAPINREHYKVISDRRYKLGSSNINGDNVRILKQYTKLGHKVRWDDSVGANINYGNIQIFFICYPSDNAPVGSDNVQLDFESTCYYTE